MIRYSLKCDNDHDFESWFQSGAAFDNLKKSGMLQCPDCGSDKVEKAMMTPRLSTDALPKSEAPAEQAASMPMLRPDTPMAEAIARLRKEVEDKSDYVGREFASEARRIHDGDAPDRAIHGEAGLEEAKALVEDGVPILPLPFSTRNKIN